MANTIASWASDYITTDTNTPTAATAIPNPGNNTTDLGNTLRDVKAVIRQESVNKGWEPAPINATRVTNTTFKLAGDYTAVYPVGIGVRFNINGTIKYSHVANLAFSSGNTTFTTDTSPPLNSSLNTATFSSYQPSKITPYLMAKGYPQTAGSPFPVRILCIQQARITDGNTTVVFVLPYELPDTNYTVLIQAVGSTGTAASGAYRFLVTKTTQLVTLTLAATPGGGVNNTYELCVVVGT